MNVYLTSEEHQQIADIAERLGVTKAYVVRLILRETMGLPIGGKGMSEMRVLTEQKRSKKSGHVQNLTHAR